jgi:succinoglycan biosynthesis transport protein ExoP
MARKKKSRRIEPEIDDFDDEVDYDSGSGSGSGPSGHQSKQLVFDILARWHWLALFLVLGVLGAFYYLSKAPKIYDATATLLVVQKTSGSFPGMQDEGGLDPRTAEALNTIAARVKRSAFLAKVASSQAVMREERLIPPVVNWFPEWSRGWLGGEEGPAPDPGEIQPSVLGGVIGSWTSVNIRKLTRLMDITVSHPDPGVASRIVDIIATEYQKEIGLDRLEGRSAASKTMALQAAEAGKRLQEKENADANYLVAMASLQTLEEEELTFKELDRRYLEKHPKLIDAKVALSDFRKQFLSEFVLVRSSLADKAYWESNRAEWGDPDLDDETLVQIARRLLTARATILKSDIESQKGVYNDLLTRIDQLKATADNEKTEVTVSSLSTVPGRPSSPNQTTVIAGGGFLGLFAGLALAFLLVKLDNKIHTVPQVEALTGLPVLATIRDIQPKILAKVIAEKGVRSKSLPPGARKWDPRFVFRPGLSETLYAEMFRILRASITLLGDEKRRSVTLFSSALPGEGKTLVSSNFAIASAQQGKKTLLIDLDLRKPAVHRGFGLKRSELKAGATELLAGKVTWQEAATRKTGQENLTCIFAGVKAPNPGELLSSNAVSDLLESLAGEFDVVVIDSAPLLAVPDTRLIIPVVDNFCLVVRAEQTPKGAVRKAVALLSDDGIEPAGIVINGYEEKTGLLTRKYRYGYGYGGYGQYSDGNGSYGAYGSGDDDA